MSECLKCGEPDETFCACGRQEEMAVVSSELVRRKIATRHKNMNFQDKCKLAEKTKIGDKWKHCKNGRIAEVIGRVGNYGIRLRHESGRETTKLDHYLAGDFDLLPNKKASSGE